MAGILLIRDLAVVLVTAGVAAWICQRLGLSAVVGYLVAGAVIGPYTPPFAFVTDSDRIQTLAQIGLVFLIFSIGLNLSLNRLKRLGISTVIAAVIGAFLVLNGCRVFGWAIGWSATGGLFLAGMLMVSSSAIISKVLDELNLSHERPGQLALAVTVFEDLVAITMLTILSSITQFGKSAPTPLLPTMAALAGFIVMLAVVSLMFVPRLLTRLSQGTEPEIRTLVVGGILLALSWLAVQVGYSLALGAFIFGVMVGSTRFKSDVERQFDGMRQLFGAVFFVAVGMMVDFKLLSTAWPYLVAVTGLALVLRPIACSVGFLAVGNSSRESIQAGLSLTPLGEFTFVIAQLGVESGVLPRSAYPIAAGASLLTAFAAPALTRRAESISGFLVAAQPTLLTRWIAVYHEWLHRLQSRRTAGILWKLARKRVFQTAILILLLSALLLFIRPIYEQARTGFESIGSREQAFPFIFWSLFGILLLGPLIAIWRNLSALIMIIADAATLDNPRQTVLRPLLERTLSAVALAFLCLWLLAVLPSGWSLIGPAGGVLILLISVATVFWRRFVKFQTRFELRLLDRLHRASQVTSASSWSDTLPQQTADWNLEIDEVTLPADSMLVGKTLRQAAIRSTYGCSVLGIDRQGLGIVNPNSDTVLYPHDKLLLLGDHGQLKEAARGLLKFAPATEEPTAFDELTMETVKVPESCPLAGRPLIELNLIRRHGIQIGGIRRGNQRTFSPGGQDHFEVGDELLLLGTHAQIRDFSQTFLASGPRV